jgi:hypothetical protein
LGERTFEVFCNDRETRAPALCAAAAHRPVLHAADMVRPDLEDVPEAPLPEGLVVRTPREDELGKVREAIRRPSAITSGWHLPGRTTSTGSSVALRRPGFRVVRSWTTLRKPLE